METIIILALVAAVIVMAVVALRTPKAQCGQHEKCDAVSHENQSDVRPEVMDAARSVMKKHKATLDRLDAKPIPKPKHALVMTTNGYAAIVDTEDFERVSAHNWIYDAQKKSPAVRMAIYSRHSDTKTGVGQSLKTFILGFDKPEQGYQTRPKISHKNGDPLDCRKRNLKAVKRSPRKSQPTEEKQPTPIQWIPAYGYYRVQVPNGSGLKYIGDFRQREAAEAAYAKAMKAHA